MIFLLRFFSLISFLLSTSMPIYGIQQDSSLMYRSYHQQLFAIKYIKEYEPNDGFRCKEDVLNFVKELTEFWSKSVSNQPAIYRQFDTYAAIYTTLLFKNPLPPGSDCLIYSEIALPSFLNDINFLRNHKNSNEEIFIEASYLIRISNFTWATTQKPTYLCGLDHEKWENLKKAICEYPYLIDNYINNPSMQQNVGEKNIEGYKRVKSSVLNIIPILDLNDLFYQGKLEEIHEYLASNISKAGGQLYLYLFVGKRLYQKYLEDNNKALAFSILDILAMHTVEKTLPRNELKQMYLDVDNDIGQIRFESKHKTKTTLLKGKIRQNIKFNLYDIKSNEDFSTENIKQELIFFDFWSMGCKPCIEKFPTVNRISERYDDKVKVISINNDILRGSKLEVLKDFVRNKDIHFPVLVDSQETDLMKRFNINGWPAYFLVDKEGYLYFEPTEGRTMLSLDEIELFLQTFKK